MFFSFWFVVPIVLFVTLIILFTILIMWLVRTLDGYPVFLIKNGERASALIRFR
jgi:uncharacterized membrane protein